MEQNNNNKREAVKVVQTAGRDMLGDIAPEFARLNDDVLFGEVWSRNDKLSLRDRSMVTVATLVAKGMGDTFACQYQIRKPGKTALRQKKWQKSSRTRHFMPAGRMCGRPSTP